MADPIRRNRRASRREIDISTNASQASLGWQGYVILWFTVFGVALVSFALAGLWDLPIWWSLIFMLLAGVLVVVASAAWTVIVKRGVWTWLPLARLPAKLRARGEPAAAEAAYARALARARRFAPSDHRRGVMLSELGIFARLQGRVAESLELGEESVEVLAQHLATDPFQYFVALNNYGISFIQLKDYATAQSILVKAVDLMLAVRKREADKLTVMPLSAVQLLQFVLHLNLAFLFIEMRELAEAEGHLREADVILPILAKRLRADWHDHYIAMCALWEFESGSYAHAEGELAGASNPNYPPCLRLRARLHLVRQEYAQAEQVQRTYFVEESKKGTLHRPDLVKATLELAESLYGQGKQEEAWASVQEARSIVADFALPADAEWRQSQEKWLQRARELGKADMVASLEAELQKTPTAVEQRITILEKFRAQPNE